jgi:hypothetical protein
VLWPRVTSGPSVVALAFTLAFASMSHAQHEGHGHPSHPVPADTAGTTPMHRPVGATPGHEPAGGMGHAGHMAHAGPPGHETRAHGGPPAFYGPYPFTREASGTAWQPESAPHLGWHVTRGSWSLMAHGFAFVLADRQAGPRGDDQVFGTNMVMGLATRPLGPGRLGLRAMASLEPLTVGKRGYPLLLQTGETADGRTHLLDRQHPHDLFMELAGSWSVADATRSAFVYAGLPGEPALGPPAFMHRVSGEANPESPIGHHWLDSTHITFGVVTLGLVRRGMKAEASAFRGREPDQDRYDIEAPKLDSYSGRLSWNPGPDWSIQMSAGRLESPEQLAPGVDTDRMTASATWSRRVAAGQVSATAAWGRNRNRPGATLDAWLLEGTAEVGNRHTILVRAERVEKDELFREGDPRTGEVFPVGKIAAGYTCDVLHPGRLDLGLGAMGSLLLLPDPLKGAYGGTPLSASLFARARVR